MCISSINYILFCSSKKYFKQPKHIMFLPCHSYDLQLLLHLAWQFRSLSLQNQQPKTYMACLVLFLQLVCFRIELHFYLNQTIHFLLRLRCWTTLQRMPQGRQAFFPRPWREKQFLFIQSKMAQKVIYIAIGILCLFTP